MSSSRVTPVTPASPWIIASRSARARSVQAPGRPSPIGDPSNDGHRQDPGHARGQEGLAGGREVGPRERALERAQPDPRAPVEQPRSGGAGQDRAIERGRRELEGPSPPADAHEEDVRRRPLGQVVVDGQEQGVVRAGAARLEPRVDVLRAGRRLERRERVLRVAPDRRRDEVQAALQVGIGHRGRPARPGSRPSPARPRRVGARRASGRRRARP